MLNVIDEFTRECIAIRVERKLKAVDVIDVLSDLFILRGILCLRAYAEGAGTQIVDFSGLKDIVIENDLVFFPRHVSGFVYTNHIPSVATKRMKAFSC